MKATFKFIGIEEGSLCPHCGADGKYIYTWEEDGVSHSAMAGCYKSLTGMLEKGEDERYFEKLAEKRIKGKDLTGWDKSIARLLQFKQDGKYPAEWCDEKIRQQLSERKQYLSKKRY